MPTITIRRSGNAQSIRARIRNESRTLEKKVKFDQNGQARVDLPVGRYRLGCSASGKIGATYKVEVTSPPESVCAVEDDIGGAGFDFGAVKFRVL